MNKNNDDIPVAMPVPIAPPDDDYDTYNNRPTTAATIASSSLQQQQQQQQQQQKSFRIPPASPNDGRHSKQPTDSLTYTQVNTLVEQGYTQGLAQILHESTQAFPLRFWIVDNSGSMAMTDGHRLISPKKSSAASQKVKIVPCTRWKEIQETVEYHAQMAALLQAPTVFRLLNDPGVRVGPQEFSIAQLGGPERIDSDLARAQQTMANASPTGVTPLARHIVEIRQQIVLLESQLNQEGRKVVIILATDGLPTNEYGIGGDMANNEFVRALKSMEGLPIWIVIRLCTDEDSIVEFYNSLDSQLELSIEVLDDFIEEAGEVNKFNPWLNYTLCIHRMREMGLHNRIFDLLDERALTLGECGEFCSLLFGKDVMDGIPDPEEDLPGFVSKLQRIVNKEKGHWNPIKKKVMPWISLEKISAIYGDGSCSIM